MTGPPYEPLKLASDKDLILKSCFLLALASAKRVSELHSLMFCVSHSKNWCSCPFSFVPGFVAKTQNLSMLNFWFDEFSVNSLHDFVGGGRDEMLLCPVCSL